MIEVAIEGSESQDGPLLLEDYDNSQETGIKIQRSLFMLNEKGEATACDCQSLIPLVEVSPVCHVGNNDGDVPSIAKVRQVGGNETMDTKQSQAVVVKPSSYSIIRDIHHFSLLHQYQEKEV